MDTPTPTKPSSKPPPPPRPHVVPKEGEHTVPAKPAVPAHATPDKPPAKPEKK